MKKVNVIDMVKVKSGVAAAIKEVVEKGFYRVEREDQLILLAELRDKLDVIYGTTAVYPVESTEETKYGLFNVDEEKFQINRISIITFLNMYRASQYYNETVETEITVPHIDIMAWSCRAFKLACPKSFEKSVKAGNVANMVWDEETNTAVTYVSEEIESLLQ